jgi:hypothetical protein
VISRLEGAISLDHLVLLVFLAKGGVEVSYWARSKLPLMNQKCRDTK